jgi:hypothetical protein
VHAIEEAILRTILYSDVFDFPLTCEEIHHFVIHYEPISLADIQHALVDSQLLRSALLHQAPYYALCDRPEIIQQRQQRNIYADQLLPSAHRYAAWLARLPFVRMVAITGSLAVQNPDSESVDFDYFIVVEPDHVWVTRALAILLVRMARLYGVELCPNYVLAADQLEQRRKDLFIAREISQMIPVFGPELYACFRDTNTWAEQFQPNASQTFYPLPFIQLSGWSGIKQSAEWLLRTPPGQWLESWEYQRKSKRFTARMEAYAAQSSAEIGRDQVKGHFNDYGNPALNAYKQRLSDYGLSYPFA